MGEPALGYPGIGVDQQQHPGATRRQVGHALGEVPEHRLLREPQPVAEQPRQHAGLEPAAIPGHFVWTPNDLIPS